MCTQSRRKGARLKRNVITDDGKEKGEKMGEGNTPTFLDIFIWGKNGKESKSSYKLSGIVIREALQLPCGHKSKGVSNKLQFGNFLYPWWLKDICTWKSFGESNFSCRYIYTLRTLDTMIQTFRVIYLYNGISTCDTRDKNSSSSSILIRMRYFQDLINRYSQRCVPIK